jgi:hypothetical protein
MTKFTIRLLTLAICVTPLVALPVITHANAATSEDKPAKKHPKKVQGAQATQDAKFKSPFSEEERKAAGNAGY